jgi:hypothetical protein
MKTLTTIAFLTCALSVVWAQDSAKRFDWVRASDEMVQLDPGDYFSGRVYRPGPDGGNMHVIIQARLPITVAMVPAEQWKFAQQHPGGETQLDYHCMRDHITSTTYECHLPPNQHMVLVMYDERHGGHAIFHGVGVIIDKGVIRKFVSPNNVQITYHSWSCVANCLEPEFRWVLLSKEKYEPVPTPKLYGLAPPENDGQKLWVKIKSQVPMTLAVVPSNIADQIYDHPDSLNAVLSQTSCKQRGVQTLEFDCTFNIADGPQSLLVLPDPPLRPHKKAQLEVQTYKCVANCNLLVNNEAGR